eukprot:scaffold16096_cov64-Attheya_sp.AAC.6
MYTRMKSLRTFTDPVLFPRNSSLIVGRLKLLVRNSSNLSGRLVIVTMRSCLSSDVLLTLYPANMAAPASGHRTFGSTVGYGLGLGVGLFMRIATYTGFRTVAIKTLAAMATPVPPTTVTTDIALTVPATAALEAAIFTSRLDVSTVLST